MSNHFEVQTLETLAKQFKRFAERECETSSPLYQRFSRAVAQDEALLGIAQGTRPGQLAPNVFFAAIHFLLLSGYKHDLMHFYPSISQQAVSTTGDPFPYLQSFAAQYRSDIREIIGTRIVQTNEVRRCACFLPALFIAYEKTRQQPFHFVDVGASAGFNLLWDQYGYDYQGRGFCGDRDAAVQIRCEAHGDERIALPINGSFPTVASRVGIELAPIDIMNPEEVLWLRALIFPDDLERAKMFTAAMQGVQTQQPRIVGGDGVALLPQVLAAYRDEQPICALFSFAVNQMFSNGRQGVAEILKQHSQGRTIFEVSIGYFGGEYPHVILAEFTDGELKSEQILANCHLHGRWIEWLASDR